MNSIEVKHLTKAFGGLRAVDDLSVVIPRGVATGLIGPNGSGKTTLMNLLTGTLAPDCGEIVINSPNCHCEQSEAIQSIKQNKLDCRVASALRNDNLVFKSIDPTRLRSLRIARTFQDGRLVNQMSVADNLLLAITKTGIGSGLMEQVGRPCPKVALSKAGLGQTCPTYTERVDVILQKINLWDKRDVNAEDLSYGQRKLLELGRAIIQDADIYLLDEPFTGLFPAVVEQVAQLLTELKNAGKTLVIIEHNIGLIRRLCDNIIVLDHGQLLASGTPAAILANKKVQEAYLGV